MSSSAPAESPSSSSSATSRLTDADWERKLLLEELAPSPWLDPVNHPAHYAEGWSNGAEIIDITEHLNFCRGNAVKYLARAGAKDPARELEDLRKAEWYVQREIARVEAAA